MLKGKKPQTRSHGSIAAVTCYSRASALQVCSPSPQVVLSGCCASNSSACCVLQLQAATSSHDITVQARIYYSKAAALAQRWWGADSELAAAFTKKLDHFTRRTKQGLAALGPAARLHALQVPVSAVAAVEPWLPSGGRAPRPALTTLMDTGGFSSSLRSTQSSFLASEAGSRPVSVAGSAFEEEEEPSWRLKGDPARTGRLEEVASVVGLPDSGAPTLCCTAVHSTDTCLQLLRPANCLPQPWMSSSGPGQSGTTWRPGPNTARLPSSRTRWPHTSSCSRTCRVTACRRLARRVVGCDRAALLRVHHEWEENPCAMKYIRGSELRAGHPLFVCVGGIAGGICADGT